MTSRLLRRLSRYGRHTYHRLLAIVDGRPRLATMLRAAWSVSAAFLLGLAVGAGWLYVRPLDAALFAVSLFMLTTATAVAMER